MSTRTRGTMIGASAVAFAILAVGTSVPVSAAPVAPSCRVRDVTQRTTGRSFVRMVKAAEPGDRLVVRGNCRGGVTIDKDLTVRGSGKATLTGRDRVRVLRVAVGARVMLRGLVIRRGAARRGGGILNAGTVTMTHVTVRGNVAGGRNDCDRRPDPTCDFHRDEWNGGGGIYNEGRLTLIATKVKGNEAGEGGGIENAARGKLKLVRSSVLRNLISLFGLSEGGGVYNAGRLIIRRSTVARNAAVSGEEAAAGGGIFNAGSLLMTDSTVSDNQALGQDGALGGGIANGSDLGSFPGAVVLTGSTVTGNYSDDFTAIEGGGVYSCPSSECGEPHSFTVRTSIIAGNGGRSWRAPHPWGIPTRDPDCLGQFTSAGHNIIGIDRQCIGFGHLFRGDLVGTIADPIVPRLGRLRSNGGRTFTNKLLAGSPAIDAAGRAPCASTRDQRGVRRPQHDRCDIGAFERRR